MEIPYQRWVLPQLQMEANLARLEQQEQKYTAELNAALAEYEELKAQAADFDPDGLTMAQLEIRPQKEASAESRVQAAYGDKYDFWTMIGAKRDVAEILGEEETRSIIERMRRKEREKEKAQRDQQSQRKNKKIVVGSGDTPLLFSKDRIYRMHLLKNSA